MAKLFSNTIKTQRNKAATAFALVLILAASMLIVSLPIANAQKTTINLRATLYPIIGENSPTLFTWMPTPNPFLSPPYQVPAWIETKMWPDATITFTRPDNTVDVLNGPFDVYWIQYETSVGFNPRFELVYTPNMQGNWTVNFYWPGDSLYNAINVTDAFDVGPHHDKRTSWAMLSIRPDPAVGIGQDVLINAWVTPPPMHAYENFKDYKFTIRRGDGSIYYTFETDSEAPGVIWFNFVPDTLGNWSITFEWPGNHLYKPCNITRYINVQQDPIPYPIEDTPLPTEAWTFPVNVFNREWRNIAGPWLQTGYNASAGSANEYTQAPRTAHIRWKLPPASGLGGYIGAYEENTGIGTSNIYTSSAPDIRCVMAGRGYYAAGGFIYCIDMQNGTELWRAPGTGMSKFGLGSFVVGATRNRAPVIYTFGNQFIVYDALTGAINLNVTGMPMLLYDDPYVISTSGTNMICWTTAGNSANFASRIIWNISDPYLDFPWSPPTWAWNYLIHNGLIIYSMQRYGRVTYEDAIIERIVARNLTTGELVYDTEVSDRANPETWIVQQGPSRGSGYGLFYYPITGDPSQINTASMPYTTGGYIAHDVTTGQIKWKSEPFNTYPWGVFFSYNPEACGYGMVFALSYSGIWALNATNGKVVWHYSAGDSGMETPYNTWPFGSVGSVVGGGIIFAPNTEHSPTFYYRGIQLHAVDVFTGDKVWSIMGYYNPTAIAYGTLLAQETTSGFTYAFGKGETKTTISASANTIGGGILIQGKVTDQSPAQKDTPAVSDESMTAWMEYLHHQQPCPDNITGVRVHLTAIDQSGSQFEIGTVTTDPTGLYAMSWNPPAQGTYTIYATFEGSESYYASYASTAVGVGPTTTSPTTSPAVSPPPTSPAPTSPAPTQTVSPTESIAPTSSPSAIPGPESDGGTGIYIAIAAAVIIVAVIAVALVLRRRSK